MHPNTKVMNESDTNADTCCLGRNFIPLSYTNRSADVYPYHGDYKPLENIPIVSAATAYDHPNGQTYILVVNEALYYGEKMDHSLLNPNQIRFNGLDYFDNPLRDDELCIQIDDDLYLPLNYRGTKCSFESRAPTRDELNNCTHLHLTSNREWNPDEVDLRALYRVSQVAKRECRQVYQVRTDTVYESPSPYDYSTRDTFKYLDPASDEAILSEISSSLVQMKEMSISSVQLKTHDNEVLHANRTFINKERHVKLSPESLAENWFIGTKRAEATIKVTTQRGIRSALMPISRRYRADRFYDVKRLRCKIATDTMFSPTKSIHQNTCAQIYSHKAGFSACYPQSNTKGETLGDSLNNFVHDFGAPDHLTFDGYSSQVGRETKFYKRLKHYGIDHHVSAPRRPNENPAEGCIRELKRRFYRVRYAKRVPKRLWDYLLLWISETGNLSVSSSKYANGRTSTEIITGETPDISEYVDFSFYDWVIYRSNAGLDEPELGRWCGVSHKVGQLMSYWILPISGIPISCVTVQRLTGSEINTDDMKRRMNKFDDTIYAKFEVKDQDLPIPNDMPNWNRLSLDEDDPEFGDLFIQTIDDEGVPHADDIEAELNIANDNYSNMEIGLPRGADGEIMRATVKRRAVDADGRPIGVASSNPMTDTRLYKVEFVDGTEDTISANIIAENLLSQIDAEGHRQLMLKEIIDHRKLDTAIDEDNAFFTTHMGIRRRKQTTRGWDICVEWKDGTSQWIAMKDMKNSYPIELAEYATNNDIAHEPAFAWWVPYTLRKRKLMINKVKSKYWQRTHKYGIRVPKSVEEAHRIDDENKNSLWRDAIAMEMPKILASVEEYEGTEKELDDQGFQQITGHMIFDIKLGENFRRKARFVADGHKTETPSAITYSTVVSRDSVRICLTIAALNDLDILSADIENAYLTAPCREKVWLRGGLEFGKLHGKILIVRQALYGLKSSGASFRSFLAERLDAIGFKSSIGDHDVWMRSAHKPDGEQYYEYILCYVDDLICISFNPRVAMSQICENKQISYKKNQIEPPEFYLGARLAKKDLNGNQVWTMTSTDYVKAAVENLENKLREQGMKLPSRAITPIAQSYVPELDSSPELNSEDTTSFQEMIGILRWAVEIGRVDILTELSMLSAYQASPRQGHLEQVHHIFAYLKHKPKLTLYFDPTIPPIDPQWFAAGDSVEIFREQYRDAKEELPPEHITPISLGCPVSITAYVDASHAANKVTRRSHTGFIIFLNRAPIMWYSKRQNTIEASTFSSEFIAAKCCIEHIIALRFKLRMFGIPIDGPAKMFCDNESVVKNSSVLSSTLNKKHSSIAYHSVRWAVAAGIVKIAWIDTKYNLADAMTKRLTVDSRDRLFGEWTY